MTAARARELGLIPDAGGKSRVKKAECPGCKRQAAMLKLVEKLLSDEFEIRLEHRFHPKRKWRFDLAIMAPKIALEIDGGGWVHGRHHRESGRQSDNKKDTEAQLLGWKVFRVSWEHVMSGEALALLRRVVREVLRGEDS
jgi:very-short-patch-repair endonuclease